MTPAPDAHPHVAAVVLNFNGAEQTLACLRSLLACDWPSLTPIVVDNGSVQDIAAQVAAAAPHALWISNGENLGFAGGMNVGIRAALELETDYVLLLNNDTVVEPASVTELVRVAAGHPDAGIVCPLILAQDRPEVIVSAGLRCDLRRGHQGPPIGAGEPDHGQYSAVRAVDAPAGAAMLAPVSVIRRVGMLDDDLFLYGEDVEWGMRMRDAGLRVYVTGRARVWHGVSMSSGGAGSALSAYYLTRNALAVSARRAPLRGPRALLRTVELLGANLLHARRADAPLRSVRAVALGWRDYRRGRVGAWARERVGAWPPQPGGRSGAGGARGVAISTGFDKTHMTTAASAAQERGALAVVFTGAYPMPRMSRLARAARRSPHSRLGRLLDRGERLPAERLRPLVASELPYQAAKLLGRRRALAPAAERLAAASWTLYGWAVSRRLARMTEMPGVFHFRAGYGQASIDVAQRRGMHVLCDHAIAHPATIDGLVHDGGRLGGPVPPRSRLDRLALRDIERSDSVLVNSSFVARTFVAAGWAPERVHVIYLGVDDNFLHCIPPGPRQPQAGALRLIFAGRFERRKGADVLVQALASLDAVDWELALAGPLAPEAAREHAVFLRDPRVTVLGHLRRAELARELWAGAVFVFPSLAEGSARVVFEALACGCYVITTPNSGSIVQDGVHGALVAPGDPVSLRAAVVAADADREALARTGTRNARLIRERYHQGAYGEALSALYARLADASAPPGAVRHAEAPPPRGDRPAPAMR